MAQPIRAVIVENRLVSEHTEYRVELCAGAAKLSSVSRRFREFQELHSQLSKFKHAFPIPPIPPKKFFGRTNPDFVVKRQRELQRFLDELVKSIVANPPAEAAWRLLCLFLALDPKQYVPESILNLTDQTGGTAGGNNSGSGGVTGASGTVGSQNVLGVNSSDKGSGFDVAGTTGMLAVPDADSEHQHDLQSLEAEDIKRMEKIVDDFARETINVSRLSEERLQVPSDGLLAKVNFKKLAADFDAHILSGPLVASTESITSPTDADGGVDDNSLDGQMTDETSDDVETRTFGGKYPPIVGADELVVSLDTVENEVDAPPSS
mmetsp:Transcript_6196/g.9760  ORF Transcript_6196/g.9760 Transcript_6196/m.9760 type:complete len:321 (+) Transcript_6196:204-1166(+)|eukprot:CAMPEP_0203755140 /NCGR_PEP_ID=MMETSP0098-20131031/8637_1 /ASSEMBLY_ACC=CAM_ASM_000208 /TAXON_ID=96639 /ORGANISM=" , Strain NY0313808BC1" /LENGTH=320 /DNA_ID=CAMNT_0050646477 /DNA_START=202 /DNA_END=1164 /DNA_ORIENTATION=-